ncbi:unnamed protein product [Urochloa humidicola]
MNQSQPVRTGDVYPSSADRHVARREQDKVIGQGQEQRAGGGGGLQVTETDLPAGRRMVTTSAGGQVMAQFTVPVPVPDENVAEDTDAVTVGEALQAAASDRPVSLADAAAVQAAEMRATGLGGNLPGGVAAAAQKAAEANMAQQEGGGGKAAAVRIGDVVGDAAAALPANKVATREDAVKVAAAAARNEGKRAGGGGGGKGIGVVDAVAAAADMNEGRMK